MDLLEPYRRAPMEIWIFGDVVDKKMFKHMTNFEAEIACSNEVQDRKRKMGYSTSLDVVFIYRQVTS